MLRSGFSSETVLAEIASRGLLESLDPATKKSLVDFGASAELVRALEEGRFRVDPAAAQRAREHAAQDSKEREAQAEQSFRSATEILHQQQARASAAASTGEPLLHGLRDKLVLCRDGGTSRPDDARLEGKKLIALYFSAHWCAPCRKFTPQLVDYYNQVEPQHPEFEIVFVSCDRSRFNWETYMRETSMPWLAIDYDRLGDLGPLRQIGGSGIPSLVLLDSAGHVLSSSFDGENYLGPQKVIADLEKIFANSSLARLP